ncbi:MAG: type II toxin-antitoxin system HipA family toxin, partial [Pseudomonadota bacterium]
KKQLSIRLNGEPEGILEQTPTGGMKFTYDKSANRAVSIAMPIRDEPYGDFHCEAYFGGLLPESEAAKRIIGKKYGVSSNNNFSLLKEIGYDCAGAISCHSIDSPIVLQNAIPLDGKIISEDELYQHIKELPKKPLFMGVDGLRLSLAGVQDKAAVCIIEDQIALAENGCPTTHILKPSAQYFEGMAENEYFCLRMAKLIGLPVPDIELRKIKDISFLLIKRYDRRIKNTYVERIHQEDFCQALGRLSAKKYQNEGGPGFKDCFELLKETSQPAVDRNLLASALVFNYLIGNMDAHGKNFSLLHNSESNIVLAPFYDIVCTKVYPELTTNMAMKIGSKYDSNIIFPRYWEELCKDISYRYLSMKEIIKKQGELILNSVDGEINLLKNANHNVLFIEKLIRFIEKNIKETLTQFKE